MPEIRETGQYKIAYEEMLKEVRKLHLSEEDFDNYIYILLNSIQEKIDSEGKIPQYAYAINANLPMVYEYKDRVYLEVMCGFEPIPEYIDDIVIGDSMIMPKSASARMDLETGEYNTTVSWQEYFIEN